ncbi:unnamed protein product [Sphagnum jensenii]|uniref:CGL160/ATPI domain-containing protein n=1 Tax=Sphagnum jensenii TaxID=128206 RepID=A0ABP1ABG0_9BRYO
MASLACTTAVATSGMAVSWSPSVSASSGLGASSRSVAFRGGAVSRVPLRVCRRQDDGVELLQNRMQRLSVHASAAEGADDPELSRPAGSGSKKAGASMLEYIASYGDPTAPVPAAIVACVPKTIHVEEGVDANYDITPDAILNAVSVGLNEPLASELELEVPTELLSPVQLASLHMRWQPRFVPVTDVAGAENLSKYSDEATGVVQQRLSNGICVNYKPKEKDFGFLSLNRAMALDSMDLDLSRELSKPSKATLDRQVAVARQMAAGAATAKRADENKPKWRFAPTKQEEEQWAVSVVLEHLLQEVNRERKDPVKEAAAAQERYLKLKNNLQNVTLAVGGAGLAGAYFSYSPEIAASYGVGLLGALVYIRMLGNSVDSVGARDAGGAVRGALGQPRLLVPVVLVMAFNRWNGLVVPEYGVMPLQLIRMLVGFFTYKAATFVETFKELLPDSAKQEKEN